MFKRLTYGSYLSTEDIYLKMLSKSNLFENDDSVYINKLELYFNNNFKDKNIDFYDKCFSFYISIEEDDFDPSIELCGLCVIMKYIFNKVWHIDLKEWVIDE